MPYILLDNNGEVTDTIVFDTEKEAMREASSAWIAKSDDEKEEYFDELSGAMYVVGFYEDEPDNMEIIWDVIEDEFPEWVE